MRQLTGRAHNLQSGDHVYLYDRGWLTVTKVDATTAGKVLVDFATYGLDYPEHRVSFEWDAPLIVAVNG